MATWRFGSSTGLCIVCCKRSNEVAICPSTRNGRRTRSQIIRVSEPSKRSFSWKGLICYQPTKKENSSFLRKGFRKDCRCFFEDLLSTILSTVAARSPVRQRLSCFCPKIIIGGVDYSAFYLFGQLPDGLLELGWVRGSEIEPAKTEFHSFVANSDRWK